MRYITKTKQAVLDYKSIHGYKFEYFDDRFYVLDLPIDTHPDWYKNIREDYIEFMEDAIRVFLMSVTSILSVENNEYMNRWRGDLGNVAADRIVDTALLKGSIIHRAIYHFIKGYDIIYQNPKTMNISEKEIKEYRRKRRKPLYIVHNQDEMVQIARYWNLINVLQPTIYESEQEVFNLQHGYAGTLDQVWYLKGGTYQINSTRTATTIPEGLYLVDFKTGKGYDETKTYTQLSAYEQTYHYKDKLRGSIGIHLNNSNKSGIEGVKIYVKDVSESYKYFEHFLHLKEVKYFNRFERPKRFQIPNILIYDKKKFSDKKIINSLKKQIG